MHVGIFTLDPKSATNIVSVTPIYEDVQIRKIVYHASACTAYKVSQVMPIRSSVSLSNAGKFYPRFMNRDFIYSLFAKASSWMTWQRLHYMIHAKHNEYPFKFVNVVSKILPVPFFLDTVYVYN